MKTMQNLQKRMQYTNHVCLEASGVPLGPSLSLKLRMFIQSTTLLDSVERKTGARPDRG